MCPVAKLLIFFMIASVGIAMDSEENLQSNTATMPMVKRILMPLNPAERSSIAHEEFSPPSRPFDVLLLGVLDALIPGTYTDSLEQFWCISEYDAFIQFVGNRHECALSLDFVRPAYVHFYPETGMISVIYDIIKDSEQFFSLELTRISDEYRITRAHIDSEYHLMRDIQDREYQEALEQDRVSREEQMQRVEQNIMQAEDELSHRCLNAPFRAGILSPVPLTREQLRAHNAAVFARMFAANK